MTNKIKNMLDYAHFNINEYKPSVFLKVLIETATDIYKMYLDGNIQPATVESVREAFNESISNYLQGAPYNDANYETILDDLILFVDENNIKLRDESLKELKGVSLTYDTNEKEKDFTVFGTKI